MGRKPKNREPSESPTERHRFAESIRDDLPVLTVPEGMSGTEFLRHIIDIAGDISVAGDKIDLDAALHMREVRSRMETAAEVVTRKAPKLKRIAAAKALKRGLKNEWIDGKIRSLWEEADGQITKLHQLVLAAAKAKNASLHKQRDGVSFTRVRARAIALGLVP